jgi:hypothetical protein
MNLGFIILAHQDLHRAGQLAKFLANNDCPVCMHIDQNASEKDLDRLKSSVNHVKNIVFSEREKCGWGQFSIVQATLNAAETLLESHPDLTNVFLASGSCLPARPLKQLMAFLERHPKIDFIESVSIEDDKWVKDGLDRERFSMYFPLSWRKHRFAFDRLVDVQRLFGVNRKRPKNISPHMGSQWWCLTADTLRKIVHDPLRRQNDRYFSKTWIPDESYFQSLARNHSEHIKPISLTFATFDAQGKPFLFYDDHLDELPKTSAFFIRKIWPGANKLYRELLTTNRKNFPLSKSDEESFNKIFTDANETRNTGGQGRLLQGRFPHDRAQKSSVSHTGFGVFIGFDPLFHNFPEWARLTKGLHVFGNLFARKNTAFYKNITLVKGNLQASPMLCNANPKGYLSNFLWSQKSHKRTAILYDMTDAQKILPTISTDEHTHFVIVKEAWLLSIVAKKSKFKGKLMRAKVLQAREQRLLTALEKNKHASCSVYSLEEAMNAPGLVLQAALQVLEPDVGVGPTALPKLKDFSKLDSLVRKLENNGISLSYVPAKKKKKASKDAEKVVSRPYVVR